MDTNTTIRELFQKSSTYAQAPTSQGAGKNAQSTTVGAEGVVSYESRCYKTAENLLGHQLAQRFPYIKNIDHVDDEVLDGAIKLSILAAPRFTQLWDAVSPRLFNSEVGSEVGGSRRAS